MTKKLDWFRGLRQHFQTFFHAGKISLTFGEKRRWRLQPFAIRRSYVLSQPFSAIFFFCRCTLEEWRPYRRYTTDLWSQLWPIWVLWVTEPQLNWKRKTANNWSPVDTVVPRRENFILFYFIPFYSIHCIHAASIARNGWVQLPVEQTGRPDHLSFT